MKLSELLTTNKFKESRVMAGEGGTNREIRSVNMMDAPDIGDFLHENELLITTAFALKDDVAALQRLVIAMAEKNCAGLGIKTRRFLRDIPPPIIETAQRLKFPLIELPQDYPLGELLTQALDCILEKRTEELKYSIEAREKFARLIIEGRDVDDLVGSLAKLVDKSAALFDRHGNLLAASEPWDVKTVEALQDVIGSRLRTHSFEEKLLALPVQLSKNQNCEVTVMPIVPHQRLGFLMLLSPITSLDSVSYSVIEQAANIIGFEMLKLQAVREGSRRFKNEFFVDFIEEKMASEREILSRGKSHGFREAGFYQCVFARVDAKERHKRRQRCNQGSVSRQDRDSVYEELRHELHKRGLQFSLFTKTEGIAVLLYDNTSKCGMPPDLRNTILGIQQELRQSFSLCVSFGIGNPVFKIMDIPKSFRQAEEALESQYKNFRSFFVQTYQTKDSVDLLRLIPRRELEQYREAILGPILRLPEGEQEVLISTISAFLDHLGNVTDTAKAMFLHRNTVLYRLNKCEQICGVSLKEPEVSLRMRLAVLIHAKLLAPEVERESRRM